MKPGLKVDFLSRLRAKVNSTNVNRTASPYMTGLNCRCPRCGKGKLFKGYLKLKPCCEVCGLDFAFADSDDGAAVFVIMIAGFIVVGAALAVEINYAPPFWIHGVLWGPLILIVTLGLLRLLKGLTTSLQYHHRTSEAQQMDDSAIAKRR
jgi:uncharacterized protein (DUF983 family)